MTVIDKYLEHIDKDKRIQLERIRRIAKETVHEAEEVISYGMPTLKYQGHSFLGFDAHKNHIGIYPYGGEVIEVFKDKLHAYELSKGAIRVAVDKPISESLLKEIIMYRIEMIKSKK